MASSSTFFAGPGLRYTVMPGLNAYVLADDVDVSAGATNAPATVPASVNLSLIAGYELVPGLLVPAVVSGAPVLKFTQSGVYALDFVLNVVNIVAGETDPTSDVDFLAQVLLFGTGTPFDGREIIRNSCRMPAPGVNVGSTVRYFGGSVTTYIPEGAYLKFQEDNYSPIAARILAAGSFLYVTQVA